MTDERLAQGEGVLETLRWICTLARKMGVRSLVIEDALDQPSVIDEIECLERACGGEGDVGALTITFLARRGRGRRLTAPQVDEVVGQACVITYPRRGGRHSFVFEANLRVPGRANGKVSLLNNYVPLAQNGEITVLGERHLLRTIYFAEQNGETTVCAHSALRMVVQPLGGGRLATRRVVDLLGPMTHARGIGVSRLVGALKDLGHKPVLYDFGAERTERIRGLSQDTPWSVLCSAIESGHPALLIVSGGEAIDHVLPVLGYTLNTDEWHPSASTAYQHTRRPFLSSSSWVDHLIINDDMAGPYYCLAQASLMHAGRNPARTGLAARAVITVLPGEVDVTPAVAEQIAHLAITNFVPQLDEAWQPVSPWWRIVADGRFRPVIRTTLVDRAAYLRHLREVAAVQAAELGDETTSGLETALSDLFWVCEVSLPHLYVGNRAKVGEVVVRPSPKPVDGRTLDWVQAFRLPSLVGWREEGQLVSRTTALDGHARLIGDVSNNGW